MKPIYSEIKQSIIDLNDTKVKEVSNRMVKEGHDLLLAIEACAEGLREIGDQFEAGSMFLPELIKSGKLMKDVTGILGPEMLKKGNRQEPLGKVVIGTVPGDVHDIGKDIVATMLFVQGFEVYDLGKDVPIKQFVEKAKEVSADIVAASALLSSTMPALKELVNALVEAGSRDKIKILVGGAPVTPEWAKKIGADGTGENAVEAVKIAKELIGGKS
jgi:trimethylamine corrinoid protein